MEEEGKSRCAESVIKFYSKFENKKVKKEVTIGHTTFNVDDQYRLINEIGKGAYGVVVSGILKVDN